MNRILLLAGTAEARALAGRIQDGCVLTVSLAGRTADPAPYPGTVRNGGFGGADGLARYIEETGTGVLIDATHPFAEAMSAHAANAAARAGIPRLRLLRPAWPLEPGHSVHPTLEAALDALPAGATALLTTGSVRTAPLSLRPDCRLLLRTIEPVTDYGSHVTVIRARPPFSVEDETRLMRDHGITHLVTRNAGGESRARLDAARGLGLPVLMVARPQEPPGPMAATVDEAVAWMHRNGAFEPHGDARQRRP